MVALGEDIGGVYSTDDKLCRQFIDAGLTQDEFFWQMPLHMPYAEQLKTTIADCKNIGVRWGGSITAALFLKEFVAKGITWIHCDIAGPGGKEQPLGHLDKGAKGFAVKSVVALARELAAKK
jgi:leucyl aminopeptidase